MPLPSRVDDYSSDEGFEVPLPAPPKLPGSFRDLVSNSPGSVASLLKRFHTRRDPKRYALAGELHWILVHLFTPDNVLDGCLNSNLAMSLWRSLLTRHFLESFDMMRSPRQVNPASICKHSHLPFVIDPHSVTLSISYVLLRLSYVRVNSKPRRPPLRMW